MSTNPEAPTPPVQQRLTRFLGRDILIFLTGFGAGSLAVLLGLLAGRL